jgi:hypothetical protein
MIPRATEGTRGGSSVETDSGERSMIGLFKYELLATTTACPRCGPRGGPLPVAPVGNSLPTCSEASYKGQDALGIATRVKT